MQYLTSLLISIGLGLVIGLEREFCLVSQKDRFAGIRTFPLVAILGSITGLLSQSASAWYGISGLLGIIIFSAVAYFVRSSSGHSGITTEITIVIAFVLGILTSIGLAKEALAAAVLTTTFLSLKDSFHSFVSRMTQEELFAFIKFAVISMLLLPFLPDQGYGPGAILNPWDIGLVVVTMSLLSFVSYILMKSAGPERGIILAAVLGGLVSSTAVTWLFSARSKNEQSSGIHYASGIVVASSIMPLRIIIVSLIFVRQLLPQLIVPCLLMAAAGFVYSYVILKNDPETSRPKQLELGNPLNLTSAVYSTVLYIGVLILVYYSRNILGEQGLLISGLISGIADVDAITIAMADVIPVTPGLPVYVVLLAISTNSILKLIIATVKAGRIVRRRVITGLSLITFIALTYMATLAVW